MTAINFDELYQNLKTGVESVAKDSVQDYLVQAKADGQTVLINMKENLEQWSIEVESGAMTIEDLEFLLKAEEALNEMTALKQAGLAAVHIDKFRNGLINMILGTLTGFVKA